MAHPAQFDFFKRVKQQYPKYFRGVNVLDVGSFDVNSTSKGWDTRTLFEASAYTGIDMRPGPGVDVVGKIHEYDPDTLYDTIISGSTWEHDSHWVESIMRCLELLRPGGMFVFTCASGIRDEHGTHTHPDQGHIYSEDGEYYKNLSEQDFRDVNGFIEAFAEYKFEMQADDRDIFFVGIKKL